MRAVAETVETARLRKPSTAARQCMFGWYNVKGGDVKRSCGQSDCENDMRSGTTLHTGIFTLVASCGGREDPRNLGRGTKERQITPCKHALS